MEGKRRLAEALSQILEDIKDIDAFCRPSPALAKRLCTNLKAIYDELHVTCRAIGLLSLQIENVDYASIWEELQLRNGPEKRQLSKRIAQIVRRLGEDATEYPEEVEEEENSLNGSIQNSDDDESTADKHTTDESDQEDMTNWLNSVSKIDEEVGI